jgi:tRNA(Arg) A34 adenosine deaminase TadA
MCSGAIYWGGVGRVVYGCSAQLLGKISGEELGSGCRPVLTSGVLRTVEVVGPVLEETAAHQHQEFWPGFLKKNTL